MKSKEIVIFREYPDGEVLALFSEIPGSTPYRCLSYLHVGQHGDADYDICLHRTKLAMEEDYYELKKELEMIGYNLKIRKKHTQKMQTNLQKNYKEIYGL